MRADSNGAMRRVLLLIFCLELKACCHYEQTHVWLSQWLWHKADENQDHNYDFLSILFLSPRTAVLHPSNSLKLQAGSSLHEDTFTLCEVRLIPKLLSLQIDLYNFMYKMTFLLSEPDKCIMLI